jgi:3-oxoacyl-[acyl-carrier protein] reductase
MTAAVFQGQIVAITGASRGIGAAMARRFAAQGASLALTAQHVESLEQLAAELLATHGTVCLVHHGDVAEAMVAQSFYQDIHKKFGKLDVLAANAGILTDGMIGMVRAEDIERTLMVNVAGALHHLQAAARLMRRHKSGAIILTSSIVGRVGSAGQTVYAASKAALIGATLSAAKELGADGIRVNAIAPGFIETAMTQHLGTAIRDKRLQNIALGRFGTPEDVADVALFLASAQARYVTGQIIGVDGGMVL